MFILSQNEDILVNMENGIFTAENNDIFFETNTGRNILMGSFLDNNVKDRSKTILRELYISFEYGQKLFKIPKQ